MVLVVRSTITGDLRSQFSIRIFCGSRCSDTLCYVLVMNKGWMCGGVRGGRFIAKNIGLTKKFTRFYSVLLGNILWKNPNNLFGQSNIKRLLKLRSLNKKRNLFCQPWGLGEEWGRRRAIQFRSSVFLSSVWEKGLLPKGILRTVDRMSCRTTMDSLKLQSQFCVYEEACTFLERGSIGFVRFSTNPCPYPQR